MSFAEPTGKTKEEACPNCGVRVTFEELEMWGRLGHQFSWQPVEHRAPCGAHCAAGGYDPKEKDVHVLLGGICPRCGAVDVDRDEERA